jgi:uncharacterized delta-60 repeat protein
MSVTRFKVSKRRLNGFVLVVLSGVLAASMGVGVSSATGFPVETFVPQFLTTGKTPGGLDQSFGFSGVGITPQSPATADRFQAVAVDPKSGQTYAAGFLTEGTDQVSTVARISPDGTLDASFGTGGVAKVNVAPNRGTREFARSLGVQSNGKIVITGEHESNASGANASDNDIFAARFNSNGTLDTSFGDGGVKIFNLSPGKQRTIGSTAWRSDVAYGLALRPDDRIVLITTRGPGSAEQQPDDLEGRDFAIIQLTKDGQLDTTFASDSTTPGIRFIPLSVEGHYNQSPRQGIVQADGKVVVASYSELDSATPSLHGSAIPHLIRLTSNGNLDAGFGDAATPGVASFPFLLGQQPVFGQIEFYDVGVQTNKYVVTGYAGEFPSDKVDMISARVDNNGKLDTKYGTNGLVRVNFPAVDDDDRGRDMVIFPDGRPLMVGSGKPTSAGNIQAMAVMLTRNGQFDKSFGNNGILLTDLGGNSDSWFGVALMKGNKAAFVGGWRGERSTADVANNSTGPVAGDDSRVGRILPG